MFLVGYTENRKLMVLLHKMAGAVRIMKAQMQKLKVRKLFSHCAKLPLKCSGLLVAFNPYGKDSYFKAVVLKLLKFRLAVRKDFFLSLTILYYFHAKSSEEQKKGHHVR